MLAWIVNHSTEHSYALTAVSLDRASQHQPSIAELSLLLAWTNGGVELGLLQMAGQSICMAAIEKRMVHGSEMQRIYLHNVWQLTSRCFSSFV